MEIRCLYLVTRLAFRLSRTPSYETPLQFPEARKNIETISSTFLPAAFVLAVATVTIAGCRTPNSMSATSSAPAAPATTPANPLPASSSCRGPGSANADTTAKLAGAQWALKQDEIKNDPKANGRLAPLLPRLVGTPKAPLPGPRIKPLAHQMSTGAPRRRRQSLDFQDTMAASNGWI